MCKRNRGGFTLVELMAIIALVGAVITVGATFALPTIARETLRSAAHEVRAILQVARIEALKRNRDCRFVIDADARVLQAWDSNGTTNRTDDVLLRERRLPDSVVLARPDTGEPVSLDQIEYSAAYQTIFSATGVVDKGEGGVHLQGGEWFARISVFGAGGVQVERWVVDQWEPY